MKVMAIVKASKLSEQGVMPSEKLLLAMTKFNEELARAGALLDLSGLKPSSAGARIRFSGGKTTVLDGPFAETKELVAGYWVLQVRSLEEAVEWIRRAPFHEDEQSGGEAVVELRPFFELSDFAQGEATERAAKLGEQLGLSS